MYCFTFHLWVDTIAASFTADHKLPKIMSLKLSGYLKRTKTYIVLSKLR